MLWISSLLKWYFSDWIHAEVFSDFNNLCCSVPNLCLPLLYFMHVLNRITLKWCSAEQHREIEWLTVFFSSERRTLKFIISDTLLFRGNICRQESMDKVIQHWIRKEIIQNKLFDQKLEMKDKSPKEVFFSCCLLLS